MSVPLPVPTPAAEWHGQWSSLAHTQGFAQALAQHPVLADFTLALLGDLGAGKTTWVRSLLRALGVSGRIKSPTYAVLEPYQIESPWAPGKGDVPHSLSPSLSIWHFDFYRFNDPREWEDAGFRDILAGPGLKLLEWPEKAGELVGTVDAQLCLSLAPEGSHAAPGAQDWAEVPRVVRWQALSHKALELLPLLNAWGASCAEAAAPGSPPTGERD